MMVSSMYWFYEKLKANKIRRKQCALCNIVLCQPIIEKHFNSALGKVAIKSNRMFKYEKSQEGHRISDVSITE